MPAHARHRLQQLCRHPDTLGCQPADGPELARGRLHACLLSGARPVRTATAPLRAGLHVAARVGTRARYADAADEDEEGRARLQSSAEGRQASRPARRLLRGRDAGPHGLRPEHAVPPHVGLAEGRCLRALDGWRQWAHGALRLRWRAGDGEDAYAVGEPAILPLLSVQLHVLALLHVEFLRSAERPAGTGRGGARELDHGHPAARQPAAGRPVAVARRAEAEQRPQRLLRIAAFARFHRTAVAGTAPRPTRHPAVLGGVLPIPDDGSGHRGLRQPEPAAGARARLLLCRFVLCLRHLVRHGCGGTQKGCGQMCGQC